MKRNIILMNIICTLMWAGVYAYVPTLQAYSLSLGATAMTLGIIGGLYGIMQVILRVPLGILCDKTGKSRQILTLMVAFMVASALIFVFVPNVTGVIVARTFAGVTAAAWVIVSSLYADYHEEKLQTKAQGVINALNSAGKMGACLLCGVVAQVFAVEATFVLSLILSVACLVLMFFLTDVKKQSNPLKIKDFLKIFKNRHIILFSVLSMITQMMCFGAATTFSQVAAQQNGASSFELGMITVVFFACSAAASFIVLTSFYKKLGNKKILLIAFALGALACLPQLYSGSLALIYLAQGFAGVCYGIASAVLSGMVLKAEDKTKRAAALGVFQSLFALGIFLGPVIAGALIESFSFDTAYIVFFVLMAAGGVLSCCAVNKKFDNI